MLERYLLAEETPPCMAGIEMVLAAHGRRGALWLLRRCPRAGPTVKARLLGALRPHPYAECFRFLVRQLEDHRAAASPSERAEAPPGFLSLRVCDRAYNVLARQAAQARAQATPGDAPGLPVRLNAFTPLDERTKAHRALKQALTTKVLQDHVAALPAILEGLAPDEAARARELLRSLGL